MEEKEQKRVFSIKEDFMKDKKINDIIYGYLQTHSKFDENTQTRFIPLELCIPKQIQDYINDKGNSNEQETSIKAPSQPTIRNNFTLLDALGLIEKSNKINYHGETKKGYIIKDLANNFVVIPLQTASFLVDTATPNVIKVYIYLMDKRRKKEDYQFTKDELLKAIGYAGNRDARALTMISNIITSLVNNGLVEIESINVRVGQTNIPKMVLKSVSPYYKNRKSDNVCDIRQLT